MSSYDHYKETLVHALVTFQFFEATFIEEKYQTNGQ